MDWCSSYNCVFFYILAFFSFRYCKKEIISLLKKPALPASSSTAKKPQANLPPRKEGVV